MAELVYLNGSLVPAAEARIAALDYGFLYGYGLFETMRAYRGHVFRLSRHLERLAHSAKTLGITVDIPTLADAVGETLTANGFGETVSDTVGVARVRLTVSAGEGDPVPDPASCARPTVLVVAGEYQPLSEDTYRAGYRAVTASLRRNHHSPLAGIKSLNFTENLLARQEAGRAGVDEAILLNDLDRVAEASMSNLFVVTGDVLRTPPLDAGILPGITREAVLELAERLGITAMEDDITLDELRQAGEAFLTNSVIEVMPLTGLDGQPIGDGTAGPVTQKLREAYHELVRSETSEAAR